MKNIKLLGFLTAALFATAFYGCDTQVPGETKLRNFSYISEPSAVDGLAYIKSIMHEDEFIEFPFSVNLVDYALEQEVVATLSVDNATLVNAYNTDKGTDYIPIEQGQIEFSGTGVVQNGNVVTVTVPLSANKADVTVKVTKSSSMLFGKKYAVAVKMTSVEGGIIEAGPGNWATMLIPVQVLKELPVEVNLPGTPIPVGQSPNFGFYRDDYRFAVSTGLWNACFAGDFTLECWLFLTSFGRGSATETSKKAMNTQIFDNRKYNPVGQNNYQYGYGLDPNVDEFFMRFNEATSNTKSDIEIKAFGGSGAGSPGWMSGEWVHLAVVYKRRDNCLTSYRNGELLTKVDGYPEPKGNPETVGSSNYNSNYPADGKLRFKLLSMIGTHSGGIGATETMSVRELRMWNVARSDKQIADYMRLAVNTAEPRLVAYWPFDYSATTTSFPNIAEWAGTDEIPVAPAMAVASGYFKTWRENVDFSTVPVTLLDGSKDTGSTSTGR